MPFDVTIEGGVAEFVLDNPPQNRLNTETMMGFVAGLQRVQGDDSVRVVVLRAAGDNFSFGGEIASWDMENPDKQAANFALGMQIADAFENLAVPVIVAVQGNCTGGGFEMALRADVILAAESARFGHTEGAIGVFTLLGGVQRVAENAGRVRAMRWALTSEKVSAADAYAAGVVTEVVPDDQLAAVTAQWTARLVKGATRAHAGHKAMLRAWASGGVKAADALIPGIALELLRTEDARMGVAAAIVSDAAGVPRSELDFSGR